MMSRQESQLQLHYRDWLHLSIHLLWSYDDERKLSVSKDAKKGMRRRSEFHEFTHNAAWLVRKGWIEIEHGGQCFRAGPGEWLIAKPTQRVQRLSDEIHLLSVAFEASWPDGRPLLSEGLSCIFPGTDYPRLEKEACKIARLMDRIAPDSWNAKDHITSFDDYLKVQGSLALWLQTLVGALGKAGVQPELLHSQDECVMHAVRLLESHPLHDSIKLEELAVKVGMSPNYLGSLFKQHIGKTPAKFRNDLKLDYAKRNLGVPDVRTKEVAMDLGFVHLSQFSRWFKMHTEISPREFVRKRKGQ